MGWMMTQSGEIIIKVVQGYNKNNCEESIEYKTKQIESGEWHMTAGTYQAG